MGGASRQTAGATSVGATVWPRDGFSNARSGGMWDFVAYLTSDDTSVSAVYGAASVGDTSTTFSFASLTRAATYALTVAATLTNGLTATFYDAPPLAGPIASRTDPTLDFSVASGALFLAQLSSADGFSARWRGVARASCAGVHTFYFSFLSSDERGGVFVSNRAVVDAMTAQAATEMSGTVSFSAGNLMTDLNVFYLAGAAQKGPRLSWKGPTFAKQIVPSAALFVRCDLVAPPPLVVVPAALCATTSSLRGGGLSIATVGVAATFALTARDAYSNVLTDASVFDPSSVAASFLPPPGPRVNNLFVSADGVASAAYTPLAFFTPLTLSVTTASGAHVGGSPLSVTLRQGAAQPVRS